MVQVPLDTKASTLSPTQPKQVARVSTAETFARVCQRIILVAYSDHLASRSRYDVGYDISLCIGRLHSKTASPLDLIPFELQSSYKSSATHCFDTAAYTATFLTSFCCREPGSSTPQGSSGRRVMIYPSERV